MRKVLSIFLLTMMLMVGMVQAATLVDVKFEQRKGDSKLTTKFNDKSTGKIKTVVSNDKELSFRQQTYMERGYGMDEMQTMSGKGQTTYKKVMKFDDSSFWVNGKTTFKKDGVSKYDLEGQAKKQTKLVYKFNTDRKFKGESLVFTSPGVKAIGVV